MIAQDMLHVEHYIRQDEDQWLLREYHREEQMLELRTIGCTLTLEDIYEKVSFMDESDEDEGPNKELHPTQ
ncbi:MAG: hypothetical protein MI924_08280 [Chloroflexales bacterium]|nr:hypothetical protein [Chloroflexales bacterium]